jgi:hypothetical protein
MSRRPAQAKPANPQPQQKSDSLALTRFDQSPSGTTRVVALKGLSVFARLFGWIHVAGSQDSGGGIAMATA